ncbi:MAG: hypothetical protein HZA34_01955 [Candidatus Pacebacteria bacterium]|nr:hypothetical protein [Candidatus Paceibacterota bacterium]
MNCAFFIFLFLGLFEGLILYIYRVDIFDYNSELGFNTLAKNVNRKGEQIYFLRNKKIAYNESPTAQKIWIFLTRILGVVLGWILLWFLLDKRLAYFSNNLIQWEDFALFLLAYIGISGRLPTIPESVQDWFKK